MTHMIPFNRGTNRTLSTDFNSMLDNFFGDFWAPTLDFSNETFKIDVKDNENEYVVEADLPGVSKDEINLEMRENTLGIQVKREELKEDSDDNYVHKERRFTSMSRSIYLRDVKANEIDAKLEDGVLTVTIPKVEKSELIKQINIR